MFSLKIYAFFDCLIKVCDVLRVVRLIFVKRLLGVAVGTVIHFYEQLLHQGAPQKHKHPYGWGEVGGTFLADIYTHYCVYSFGCDIIIIAACIDFHHVPFSLQ